MLTFSDKTKELKSEIPKTHHNNESKITETYNSIEILKLEQVKHVLMKVDTVHADT